MEDKFLTIHNYKNARGVHPNEARWKGHRVTLTCAQCGKSFERQRSKVSGNGLHFCGDICRKAWNKIHPPNHRTNKVTKPCEVCGTPITRRPSRMPEHPTCSHTCRGEWTKRNKVWLHERSEAAHEKVMTECYNCGITFHILPYKLERDARHFHNDDCKQQYLGELHVIATELLPGVPSGTYLKKRYAVKFHAIILKRRKEQSCSSLPPSPNGLLASSSGSC